MVKKALISLTIVLLTSLTVVNLYDEKAAIQIDIVNEIDIMKEVHDSDVLNPVQLDKNDYLYYERESYRSDSRIFIYRVNMNNYMIDLLKEVPEEYKYITALYYSDKDKKIYMGAYGEFPYKDQKDMPSSYLIRFNADMEIEQAVRIDYNISNFFEVGDKIYAECNSEHDYGMSRTNKRTMHEIDKEKFNLKEVDGEYTIFASYEMKNGNNTIIKVKNENLIKLIANREAVDVVAEIIDKNGTIMSSNEVKNVYPFDIMFVELLNENVVFNLPKNTGLNTNNQIYMYVKNADKYELIHKKNVKIPSEYSYFGVVQDKNYIGILISEVDLYEGKNEIWLFDENLEKLIKKYEIKNLIGNTFADRIEIDGDKNKIILHNNSYLKIGVINFIE